MDSPIIVNISIMKVINLLLSGFLGLYAIEPCSPLLEEYESHVLFLCEYIPDHGLRNNAADVMTESYYYAYKEADDLPGFEMDGEFLDYFVSGNGDSSPIFSVKSIKRQGDNLIAKIGIKQGFRGIPYDEEETIHTLLLAPNNDGYGGYLIADYDNTLQECLDYIKEQRSYISSGKFEEYLRLSGLSASEIERYRREIGNFYDKYGTDEERYGIYSQNDNNDNLYSSSVKGGKIIGKWTHVLQSGGDIGRGNFSNEVLVETLILNSNGSGRLETRYKEYVGNSLISSRSGGSFTFSWEFDGSTVYIDGSPEFTYRNGSLIDSGGNAFTK